MMDPDMDPDPDEMNADPQPWKKSAKMLPYFDLYCGLLWVV
jgi:hypothetical protein